MAGKSASGKAPLESAAPALRLLGLSKRFGNFAAVEQLDLTVRKGDVYGFLGPNGSGKSTTIRMILGLVRPSAGEVRIFGRPSPAPGARENVAGFVEAPGFYEYLSGWNNLRMLAAADGRSGDAAPLLRWALEIVGLAGRANDRVGAYSQGMKQRLAIASALIRQPELLILDEPTNGLDPAGMRDVRDLIRRLSGEGLTIFLSSHLLAEVEQLCNRVAVISRGRLIVEGDLREVMEHARGRLEYHLATGDPARARRLLGSRTDAMILDGSSEGIESFTPQDVLRISPGEGGAGAVVKVLVEGGVEVLALVPVHPGLEETFLRLTED